MVTTLSLENGTVIRIDSPINNDPQKLFENRLDGFCKATESAFQELNTVFKTVHISKRVYSREDEEAAADAGGGETPAPTSDPNAKPEVKKPGIASKVLDVLKKIISKIVGVFQKFFETVTRFVSSRIFAIIAKGGPEAAPKMTKEFLSKIDETTLVKANFLVAYTLFNGYGLVDHVSKQLVVLGQAAGAWITSDDTDKYVSEYEKYTAEIEKNLGPYLADDAKGLVKFEQFVAVAKMAGKVADGIKQIPSQLRAAAKITKNLEKRLTTLKDEAHIKQMQTFIKLISQESSIVIRMDSALIKGAVAFGKIIQQANSGKTGEKPAEGGGNETPESTES